MKPIAVSLYLVVFVYLTVSCRKDVALPDIKKNISGPVDIESVQDGQFFLVLNSNKDRQYNSGSILVVDSEGEKHSSFPVRSLAKEMVVAGDDLLVIFDKDTKRRGEADDPGTARVELYHIEVKEHEPNLVFKKGWDFKAKDCIPWSVVAKKDYSYFAVACAGGGLMMGELKEPLEDSRLDLVRQYGGVTKRAMHIDSENGLLFAFPTDIGIPRSSDAQYEDKIAWDEASSSELPTSNDVPDYVDQSKLQRDRNSREGFSHQFIIYDITKEAQEVKELADDKGHSFNFKSVDDNKVLINSERRWLSFTLKSDTVEEGKKFYRTNFWSAIPDPSDPRIFYLSHRGSATNSIIKVALKDGFKDNLKDATKKTSDLFDFEQVFGFKETNQYNDKNYLTNFKLFSEDSADATKFLLIDNFRDKEIFKEQRYSLILSPLGKATDFFDEVSSTKLIDSYFGFCVGVENRVLASSSYGDSVTLFKIENKKIIKTKDIN